MISLAFNRGSMLHEARLRKLEVVVLGVFESQSESPHSSGTVLLSWSPESPLRAQIFEERKKVAAFVDREQAHTVNQPELQIEKLALLFSSRFFYRKRQSLLPSSSRLAGGKIVWFRNSKNVRITRDTPHWPCSAQSAK